MVFKNNSERPYQICVRCVMDTSDPEIVFDETGLCNHCDNFYKNTSKKWFPDENGARRWEQIVDRVKADGKGKDYDCIIGISGGIDSAYMAYRLQSCDLRVLAVHVDGGWNSEIAVKNIELLVTKLKLDLYTYVVDWEEMADIQLAFLKAAVTNQDIPQDHAFFAQLYRQAIKNKIRYFFSGGNIATECILPKSWGYNAMDLRHLKAIHTRFGRRPLRSYPQIGFWTMYFANPYLHRIRSLRPLNYLDYNKSQAKEELTKVFGWRDYGDKHHESRFTKWFQAYYLPTKFGIDKRKAHLSSMIVTGHISRDAALAELEKPPYDMALLEEDLLFIAKKLYVGVDELKQIITLPPIGHSNYPTNKRLFALKDYVVSRFGNWLGSYRW